MERSNLNSISQIINGMEDAISKLDSSKEDKDSKGFEESKKLILELQNRLSEELNKLSNS
jgi:hypothetical protein